jgi:serine protease Do
MPDYPPANSEPYVAPAKLPRLIGVLLVLLIALLLPSFIERVEYARVHGRMRAEVDVAREALDAGKITDLSKISGLVAKSVGPSVVHIDTVRVVNGFGRNEEMAQFFGSPQQFQSEGQGSGVIVDTAGYIVTNNHVIDGANDITVSLSDGRKKPASLLGSDPLTDLAVLRIDANELIAAEWGDSDKLEVGALVWAIGNPFGLDRSVTFGIISAKAREAGPYQDFLQTDAAVNPGNSGGPLVNIDGKIIGITTAIVGTSYQGVSFSIPSNRAREVYERIKATGKVARGWLGAALGELTPEIAKQLKLTEIRGALIRDLVKNAPAEKAGMQIGDVVTQWNGQPIDSPTALSRLVAATEIGSTAKATVMRDGKPQELSITVDERPAALNR